MSPPRTEILATLLEILSDVPPPPNQNFGYAPYLAPYFGHQDVVAFEVNPEMVASPEGYCTAPRSGRDNENVGMPMGRVGYLVGNVSGGPCTRSGFYYVTPLADTNLFLLVIENYRKRGSATTLHDFNCDISKKCDTRISYNHITVIYYNH